MSGPGWFARDRQAHTRVIATGEITAAERRAWRAWFKRKIEQATCPSSAWSEVVENYLPCMMPEGHPTRHAWVHQQAANAEVW